MSAPVGYSSTPLPQKLGLKNAQRVLLVGLSLLAGSAVAAAEVRPASEEEIAVALVGCWDREATRETIRLEKSGFINEYDICFGQDGRVSATSTTGDKVWGLEGLGSDGTFEVADGRLLLNGGGEGWFLGAWELSCDVVMLPGVAMQFRNCVGSSGELLANTSYSRDGE
ncbi:hypothetical protein LJR016_001794 [Devosia sp. LjRoot16]|uniref:hypothetical protein n=1 Tax=Devosia sp. LjRoot16 TaxID=3342271 RepID=UPI003ECC34BF